MLELVAQGTEPETRWRRQLPIDTLFELGRESHPWSVGWERNLSRRHLKLSCDGHKLHVTRMEAAANPVFYQGEASDDFVLEPGEHFVIGTTMFTLLLNRAYVTQDVPDPIRQQTFSNEFLRQLPYRDANQRMEVLNQLPGVISSAANEESLLNQVTRMMLEGIPNATTIGIVASDTDGTRIIHWDHHGDDSIEFQPSERLIRSALAAGQSILHVWSGQEQDAEFTLDYKNDWAFVVPFSGPASNGWGVYVSGKHAPHEAPNPSSRADVELQDDIKFAELISSTVANVLQVKSLERQQASLRPFFAPIVLQALGTEDPEVVLAPRECDVAVLFCDLRGFSKTSEEMAGDLIGLLDRVSQKLGIMTRNILKQGGVVGDFHGDAAMGFWGWPLEQEDKVAHVCLAALAIQSELTQISNANQDFTTTDLEIGMGIATGRAVVGKIGTEDQVKVTAFGPVVNLASRLEGLTRKFGASVLVDRRTATDLANLQNSKTAKPKLMTRRLARVKPFGLQASYDIFELMAERLPEKHLTDYENALDAFERGDWENAQLLFAQCPNTDSARNYLLAFIQNRSTPPENWNGVVSAISK